MPETATWAYIPRVCRAGDRSANSKDGRHAKWRRSRPLNPYRPATDTGLLKIFALAAGIILIVFSGALDCRFAFFPLGFC